MKKIIFGLFLAAAATFASADNFPNKPVKVVVPLGPGGGVDIIARIISKNLSEQLKVPVVVENRPGADGVIGRNSVIENPDGGHNLLFYMESAWSVADAIEKRERQEWQKSLDTVGSIHATSFVLVTSSKNGFKTLADFQNNIKPSGVTFGSTAVGSPLHVYGELALEKMKAKPIHVTYKTTGQAIIDVINGNLDMVVANSAVILPHIKSGSVTPLVIFNSNRELSDLPNVPTANKAFKTNDFSGLNFSYNFFIGSSIPDSVKDKVKIAVFEATKASLQELKEKRLVDENFVPQKNAEDENFLIRKSWQNAIPKIIKK